MGPALATYLRDMDGPESPALSALRVATADRDDAVMQISPEQGRFMRWLVRALGVRRILEIGTYTGYSALAMAEGLPPDGRIVTVDRNEATTNMARRFWAEAGVADRIDAHIGPGREFLAAYDGAPFDLAFIDADKENYGAYYDGCLSLLRPGGVLLIDNVFWGGAVANADDHRPETEAIRALSQRIRADHRVDVATVPIGDGVSMVRLRPA